MSIYLLWLHSMLGCLVIGAYHTLRRRRSSDTILNETMGSVVAVSLFWFVIYVIVELIPLMRTHT